MSEEGRFQDHREPAREDDGTVGEPSDEEEGLALPGSPPASERSHVIPGYEAGPEGAPSESGARASLQLEDTGILEEGGSLLPDQLFPSADALDDQKIEAEVETSSPRHHFPMGRMIALVNQKGGVGKTTSTINLGAALVEEGARVLLVDFDPQGALSVGLGFNPNDLDMTVYDLLLDRSVSFQEVVMPSQIEGMDLVPANIDLSAAEVLLVSEVAREQMLRRALAPARDLYNYILVDCPPSLGLLTVNALTAATSVIIPLETEYFALRGMALLLDTVGKVRERLNPELKIEGILATMLDSRTIHGREVLSRVTEAFGSNLFKTVIHRTIRFAEAPVAGEPILTYSPRSNGAQEYRDLAREVISR